ncbi:MAG: hypothetical protein MJ109_00980 [Kiritimatiellae bacterium]|nr:hypothetical protein [Kiritimatiellia bacterium]
MIKYIAIILLSVIALPCTGMEERRARQLKPVKPESVSIQWMLNKHVKRVLRQDGSLILPVDWPITNYVDRVVMTGPDALTSGYYYLRLRDEDGAAQFFNEEGELVRMIPAETQNAATMLADLFDFELNEDTPEYLKLSHVTTKWLVFNSIAEDEAYGPSNEEIEANAYLARRMRAARLADTPNVVTTLQYTAHRVDDRVMESVAEWPSTMTIPGNKLDVFVSSGLETSKWYLYDSIDVTGLNAITTTVNGVQIPGWHEAIPLTHLSDCFATTNVVEDAFELGTYYTNVYWNCTCKATPETPGFERLADCMDSDGDGLSDYEERWQYETDPDNWDSDGDGILDGEEIRYNFNPNSADADRDTDGDGIPDIEEHEAGTDPELPDMEDDDGEPIDYAAILATLLAEQRNEVMAVRDAWPLIDGDKCETVGSFDVEVSYYDMTEDVGVDVYGVEWPGGETTTSDISYNDPGYDTNSVYSISAEGQDFRALETGRYTFQLQADDEAEVRFGDDFGVSAEWTSETDGVGGEASIVMAKGEVLPMSVTARNGGGPGKLEFLKFGEFEEVSRPTLKVELSPSYVECSGCAHSVKRRKPSQEEFAAFSLGISGGELGCHVNIERVNFDKLVLREGDECPAGILEIGPGQNINLSGLYQTVSLSTSTNDVKIIATLVENRSNETMRQVSELTINPPQIENLEVKSIRFNHNVSSVANDAVNMRLDANRTIKTRLGEWRNSGEINDPVCYIAGTEGVTIKAVFDLGVNVDTNLTICAESEGFVLSGFEEKEVAFCGGRSNLEEIRITNAIPDHVAIGEGRINWTIKDTGVSKSTGAHKYYVILDEPKPPWRNFANDRQNVWASALDVACQAANGCSGKSESLARVTSALFSNDNLKYDTIRAYPHFFEENNTFNLTAYLKDVQGVKLVNCATQSAALKSEGAALGIGVSSVKTLPFGFLKEHNLIGVGRCNNPLYELTGTTPVCAKYDQRRTWFDLHMYNIYDGKVFDACVGPALGTMTIEEYFYDVIEDDVWVSDGNGGTLDTAIDVLEDNNDPTMEVDHDLWLQ